MNNYLKKRALPAAVSMVLLGGSGLAGAAVNVQCPGDTDGDAVIDTPDPNHPTAKCMHLIAGDSFVNMSNGNHSTRSVSVIRRARPQRMSSPVASSTPNGQGRLSNSTKERNSISP